MGVKNNGISLCRIVFTIQIYSMAFYYIAIVLCLMIIEEREGLVARQFQETKEMIKS